MPQCRNDEIPLNKKDDYYIAGWWRQRKSSKEDCAKRILSFLANLRGIDERFGHLNLVGRSFRQRVGKPVGRTVEEVMQQMREDKQFPDLGYRFSATLPPGEILRVRIDDGTWSKYSHNSVFVEFEPIMDSTLLGIITTSNMDKILRSMISIYNPICAYATTGAHRQMVDRVGDRVGIPYASWMLYLPINVDKLPALPDGVKVTPVEPHGSIIVTVQERFCADNEEHVRLAGLVTEKLEKTGILDELDCNKPDPQIFDTPNKI